MARATTMSDALGTLVPTCAKSSRSSRCGRSRDNRQKGPSEPGRTHGRFAALFLLVPGHDTARWEGFDDASSRIHVGRHTRVLDARGAAPDGGAVHEHAR